VESLGILEVLAAKPGKEGEVEQVLMSALLLARRESPMPAAR